MSCDATISLRAGRAGGLACGQPFLDDRDEPLDLRVLVLAAAVPGQDQRPGTGALGGRPEHPGDVPDSEELFADAVSDGINGPHPLTSAVGNARTRDVNSQPCPRSGRLCRTRD
jgi:hypothetical protein